MNAEELRKICLALPGVEEDIKWENDLCFTIGEKMFCSTRLEGVFGVSLKVDDGPFDELVAMKGIRPAPYLGRHKWVQVEDPNVFNQKSWEKHIRQSYELVSSKLSAKVKKKLNIT